MPVPLTARRRKAAVFGGAVAALAASLNLAHHSSGSPDRFYTVLGMVTGVVVGVSILAYRRKTSACR